MTAKVKGGSISLSSPKQGWHRGWKIGDGVECRLCSGREDLSTAAAGKLGLERCAGRRDWGDGGATCLSGG